MYTGRDSVAYDLSRFDTRERVRREVETEKQQVKTKAKPAKKAAVVSPRLVASGLFVFAVCGFMVYNYMVVSQLAVENTALRKELQVAHDQEVLLKAEQESLYNLSEIELYVQNNLDMVPFEKTQIEYIEMANPDKVEVAGANTVGQSHFLSAIVSGFQTVVEYLS